MPETTEAASSVVIHAGTVLAAPDDDPIERGAVVVADGRIQWVGPAAEIGKPDLDLGDLVLMPGFIDCHVHLASWPDGGAPPPHHQTESMRLVQAISNAQRLLRAGVTTARDLGTAGTVAGQVRDAIGAGTLAGPRLVVANQPLTITGGHGYYYGIECDDDASIRTAVRQHVKQQSDWVKVMASGGFSNAYHSERDAPYVPLFSLEEMRGLVAEAHRFGLPVAAHCQSAAAITVAFEAGVDTLEHCTFAARPHAVLDEDLVRAIAARRTPVVPTTNNYWLGVGVPWAPKEIAIANVRRLHELGVRLAAGTDMGLPTTAPELYADGLEVLDVAGLEPRAVLAAATTVAAETIGLHEATGALRPGLSADLVALEGNPLRDVASYRRVRWVMMQGRSPFGPPGLAVSSPARRGAGWSGVHIHPG